MPDGPGSSLGRTDEAHTALEEARRHVRRNPWLAEILACLAEGIESDPDEFWEPMSEYELARWRLGRGQ